MQCEDNSKLRIPLPEVCQTTDIGCVPIVNGKPDCSPQPDELPIAFDPSSTTLWLFSCKTREWIPFKKFTMCELSALNLDNITNICDILNIGVYFDAGSGCQQGTVTLAELAEKILDCLKLETKIITIGQGEGNKVKISIEGLPLDPVYVQGHNIWSEGGSGTEADPLVVATYDPICKWPTKTQAQVNAAGVKHLGACLDGEMSRVPFPPKVCELPSRNQAQVDSARSVELAACVDGEGVKIPYIKPSPPVCNSNQITLEQASAAGSDLTIVGCENGQVVRIPVSGSGFFDRDYICVPQTVGYPGGAPSPGTGPLRIDCNGNLYVWLCDQNKWLQVRDGIEGLSQLNPDNVPDICNNFRMKGWYSNNSDPCVQDVWLNLRQLSSLVMNCFINQSGCHLPFTEKFFHCVPKDGPASRDFDLYYGTPVSPSGGTSEGEGDWKLLIYCSASDSFIMGTGKSNDRIEPGPTVGKREIITTNDQDCPITVVFDVSVQLYLTPNSFSSRMPDDLGVTAFATVKEDASCDWYYIMESGSYGGNWSYPQTVAQVSTNKYNNIMGGYFLGAQETSSDKIRISNSAFARATRETVIYIEPGDTKRMWLYGGIVFATKSDSIGSSSDGKANSFNFGCYCNRRVYRGVML